MQAKNSYYYISADAFFKDLADMCANETPIRDKYAVLKVKSKQKLDKNSERHIFALFKRYNLIRNLSPDITKGETRIEIYPSILVAIPNEGINYLYDSVKDKLAAYESGEDDTDADEEIE